MVPFWWVDSSAIRGVGIGLLAAAYLAANIYFQRRANRRRAL
jgi:hypothetical protein